MMDGKENINLLLSGLATAELKGKLTIKEQLVDCINYLLVHDFQQLVQVLYRVDVDEKKLKQTLAENKDTDAAILITDLLIHRTEEKARMKKLFKRNDDIKDEDKW
jgi:hypothetical protein